MASSIPQNTGIAALLQASNNKPPPAETTTSIFGEDGFTFGDIIDIVNPLQHIPVVSQIYRKLSGDTIAPAMEIAGGALYGGPLGAVISIVSTAFQSQFHNKTETTDPDSPYMDNEATAIAGNLLQDSSQKTINNQDYATLDNLEVNTAERNSSARKNIGAWVLNSDFLNLRETRLANISTLKNKQVYQPADGIVNLAYKNTETYSEIITSTQTPKKTIDIIIGGTSDAG